MMQVNQNQLPTSVEAVTRTTRIIVFALALGQLIFAGIAIFQRMGVPHGDNVMTTMGVAFAAVSIVARFIAPKIIVASQRKRIADLLPGVSQEPIARDQQQADSVAFRHLHALFQTKTIIAAAILAGAGLFNLIAYMAEGQMTALIVSLVLIALILMQFPTQTTIENWVEGEIAAIEQMREF